jgi:hypothetical protein
MNYELYNDTEQPWVCENQCSESHSLLKGVNKILHLLLSTSTFNIIQ